MIRAQYIRFVLAVMSPGRGGSPITKAHTHEASSATGRSEERMEEILVGPDWVEMSAFRRGPKGEQLLVTRRTPLSNVLDFEEEPTKPTKKKNQEPDQ